MRRLLVKGGNLLDPLADQLLGKHDVLIEDGMIREVSPHPLSANNADVLSGEGLTVMPGLIDLHAHPTATQLNLGQQFSEPNTLVTLKAARILEAMLRRGFTTVRDASGADYGLKKAVEVDLAVGPRLFISGRALSQTGGHGDIRRRSGDFLSAMQPCACCFRVGQLGRIADGVDEVRRAARQELQMGADQIKIMVSGGVASPTDPVGALGYSVEEIRAIVQEAEARGTYVLAHAYTSAAITRAIECGVRSIEHANLISAEAASLVARHGAFVVPTLVTYDALQSEGASLGLPPESVAKIQDVHGAGLQSLDILRRAGVKIGFGTDLLGASHRHQSGEFRIRRQVLSAQEVIQSATTTAASVLRMDGRLGRLQPGAIADLLLVKGDPYADIECLVGQGERIPVVVKDGKVYFNDLTRAVDVPGSHSVR